MKVNLKDFRNLHHNESCYICGSGISIIEYRYEENSKIKTIGINDITSYLIPDYLITSDPLLPNEKYKSKINRILETECLYGFSYSPRVRFKNAGTIYYDINPLETGNIDHLFETDCLFGCVTTSELAISLALYMGFASIGLIGIDFINYGYESQIIYINECLEKVYEYASQNGQYIYNLSKASLITAFPYIPYKKFSEKMN